MKSFLFIAAVLAALLCIDVAVLAQSQEYCNQFLTCQTCLAGDHIGICGFCSVPTSEGFNCAGLSKNGQKNNFTCTGEFSTETCALAYVCDPQNFTCVIDPSGQGQSLPSCQANCSTTGKTFICDNTTWQCVIAPAGQGSSLQNCDASCKNPSDTTQAPSSTQPSHTASNSPASHSPASNSPSSNSPSTTTSSDLFACDASTGKCVSAPPGQGTSLIVCQTQCKSSNNTPANLIGLWRGFPISNGPFSALEYDFNFVDTNGNCQYTHTAGSVLSGKATFLAQSFSLTLSDNSQVSCLYTQQNTQPTTYEMIFSCSNSGKPPQSMDSAMAGTGGNFVVLASRCVDSSFCNFTMTAGPVKQQVRKHKSIFERLASSSRVQNQQQRVRLGAINDACMQYGASCEICLAQPDCGWCATTVTYNVSGQPVPGTQCAGFAKTGHTPWQCPADYTTSTCTPGWACNATTQQCVPTQPGDGNPSLQDCEAGCKAKPGPPSSLNGKWRGILINENYQNEAGVFRIDLSATGLTETLPDGTKITGTVKHYAQYMFININGVQGQIACIYSPNSATEGVVEYVTFACSAAGKNAPAGPSAFDSAMTQGSETVLAKCLSPDCKW